MRKDDARNVPQTLEEARIYSIKKWEERRDKVISYAEAVKRMTEMPSWDYSYIQLKTRGAVKGFMSCHFKEINDEIERQLEFHPFESIIIINVDGWFSHLEANGKKLPWLGEPRKYGDIIKGEKK